jgi:hypothetical protein
VGQKNWLKEVNLIHIVTPYLFSSVLTNSTASLKLLILHIFILQKYVSKNEEQNEYRRGIINLALLNLWKMSLHESMHIMWNFILRTQLPLAKRKRLSPHNSSCNRIMYSILMNNFKWVFSVALILAQSRHI